METLGIEGKIDFLCPEIYCFLGRGIEQNSLCPKEDFGVQNQPDIVRELGRAYGFLPYCPFFIEK